MNERKQRKSAFSLIEIMIALTIMSVLLSVILIPLRLGFDSLHVGQARSNNQTAVQSTLADMESDLRKAAYVFPNSELPGVTDQAPYTQTPGTSFPPYTRSTKQGDITEPTSQGCNLGASTAERWSNPSRIDFIPAKRDASGNVELPVTPGDTIVTYYSHRLKPTEAYDPIDNPLVLYRAEFKYTGLTPTSNNIDITATRFATSGCTAGNFQWLAHNVYGEAGINRPSDAQETLVTPRGLSLTASRAFRIGNGFTNAATVPVTTEAPLKPDTSFTCLDTDGDGKIDRVDISMAISNYDTSSNGSLRNGQPSGQTLRAERTVVLPNIQ